MKQLFYYIKRVPLYTVMLGLLSISLLFYIGAEKKRAALRKSNNEAFNDSMLVNLNGVIDGDEVQITNDKGDRAIVRLLGIKTFKKTGEVELSSFVEAAENFLKSIPTDKKVQIRFDETKSDKHGRLLAYILLIDQYGNYSKDLGATMIRQGHAITFTRYPFSRMADYLIEEQHASRSRSGLWGNDKMRSRVTQLKQQWQEEKNGD